MTRFIRIRETLRIRSGPTEELGAWYGIPVRSLIGEVIEEDGTIILSEVIVPDKAYPHHWDLTMRFHQDYKPNWWEPEFNIPGAIVDFEENREGNTKYILQFPLTSLNAAIEKIAAYAEWRKREFYDDLYNHKKIVEFLGKIKKK